MPKVTVIPPSINRTTRQNISAPTRRKVAAYARVSTDFEEQLTSYEAQISYYTNYIQCFSVRSKHGRFPHYHPKIKGTSRGMFLRERKYLDI